MNAILTIKLRELHTPIINVNARTKEAFTLKQSYHRSQSDDIPDP